MESGPKIIVDTDCGVDDAMALLLVFNKRSNCRVMGITCCDGNTALDNVCKNVMRVLTVCKKKEVPVFRGCSGPLICGRSPWDRLNSCHGSDGLGNYGHEFSTGGMVESDVPATTALVQLSKRHRGEITLVAIGPLTNVAMAHRIDPQFTKNLKSMVIMGGNYKGIGNVTEVGEFNFYADPEAADIVLGEAECPITLVPWETTVESGLDWDKYDRLAQLETPKGEFLSRISKSTVEYLIKEGCKQFYDCDLLAVAALLYPASVEGSIERSLAVECRGAYSRGQTILLNEANAEKTKRNKIKIITRFDGKYLDDLRFEMLEEE